MKKAFILLSVFVLLLTSACDLFASPESKPTSVSEPSGMERYYGQGMSIMLLPSYEARNVRDDLPKVIDVITRFTGGDDGLLGGLLDNVEQDVAWWGWDTETLEENPLRLLIIKNKPLHALPVTATAVTLQRALNSETAQVEQSTLNLGNRSIVRLKYVKEDVAWIAYAFKEQGYFWLALFMFTPEGLIGAQDSFEKSISTIIIDPVENDGN
ncbi:MAG TPA: hypothetical protein PLW19_03445 [Anaerolineaceae bacterium]|nr:hypothetical protein [Anaerolineaceae bacterium]